MRNMFCVIFMVLFFPFNSFANNVFTCEGKRVSGHQKTLDIKEYKIIFPTIIVDYQQETLRYIYSEHNQKWDSTYRIIERDRSAVLGFEKVQADQLMLLHFDLEQLVFNVFYIGNLGNTLTFGKCYEN